DETDGKCPKREVIANEDELKKILITKGPLNSGIATWGHSMVLVGYKNDPAGTIWIFKNNWGVNYGINGYVEVRIPFQDLTYFASLPIGPFIPPHGSSYQISCVDKDQDGYCNWGTLTVKPGSCPASCASHAQEDFDDSNPAINVSPMVPRPILTVLKSGTGSGTVKSTNYPGKIDCGSTCSSPFGYNLSAFLTADPDTDSIFTGWSGDACLLGSGGTSTVCMISMTANKSVTATFAKKPSITVLSPNGGERWMVSSTQTISWSSSNVSQVGLDLLNADGHPVMFHLVSVTGNPGSVSWTIPDRLQPGQYRLRVSVCASSFGSGACSVNAITSDSSNALFSIVAPLTCADLKITQKFYFDACQGANYRNVCFNKIYGNYKGCGYANDETKCVNDDQNIFCSL
ncbi:hypothetical protein KJ644_05300, partial [Candidatus Dependentiae bacterium]|nr:hypothetical protein [Candidatus Dependentiae bacterium]